MNPSALARTGSSCVPVCGYTHVFLTLQARELRSLRWEAAGRGFKLQAIWQVLNLQATLQIVRRTGARQKGQCREQWPQRDEKRGNQGPDILYVSGAPKSY